MLNKYRQAFAGNSAWQFSTAGFIARLPISMTGIGIWSTDVLAKFRPKLTEYRVTKNTVAVPNDWDVDTKLLLAMVKARLAEG